MKLLRSLFPLCAVCLSAFGATPSFDSFNTNDFTVTKVTAPWVITSKRTGVTNVYNNSYVTYSNSFVTITNSTLVITNTTIIFNGQTNVIGPRVWTNNVNNGIVSVVDPYNHVYVSNFYNGGWNVEFSKTVVLTNGNNVVRSDLYAGLLVLGSTTNSADAIVQFNAGPYPGATLKIQSPPGLTAFTVPDNFAVVGGGVTIMNGDWVGGTNQVLRMSFDGWNWKEEGRYVQGGPPPMFGTNYWRAVVSGGATNLQTIEMDLTSLVFTNNAAPSTPTLITVRNSNGTDASFGSVNARAILRGDQAVDLYEGLGFGTLRWTGNQLWPQLPGAVLGGKADGSQSPVTPWGEIHIADTGILYFGTNRVISPGEADGTAIAKFGSTLTHTTGNLLAVANNGTNQITIGPLAQIGFGEGTTNVLYRSGTDLLYSNGYQYPSFFVSGSGANPAQYGLTAGLYGDYAQVAGPKGVALGWDVALIGIGSTNVFPSSPLNLGSLGSPFWNIQSMGTNYVYGYNSLDAVSYSRLAVNHTGTNGVVNYDSQAIGVAGVGRPHNFQIGATNQMRIDLSTTARDTRLLLFDVDTGAMQRVSVGVADSGGVGFKVLRIPN